MAQLGIRNTLRILRTFRHGLYLDGGQLGDILLPTNEVPKDAAVGSMIDVFLYRDSDDRLIAATRKPLAMVGEFCSLQIVDVDERFGAFLDWGLPKDLLLPQREITKRFLKGDWVTVRVLIDEVSGRIVASMRLDRHLSSETPTYREGEKVAMIVVGKTELGYNVIIENAHKGLIYHTELRTPLFMGQKLDGYVRLVREDRKIDVGLDPAGYSRVAPLSERIMDELKARGGRLPFDDKSPPENIRNVFACSKKSFKQAIGALYKERRIVMLDQGISLPIDTP